MGPEFWSCNGKLVAEVEVERMVGGVVCFIGMEVGFLFKYLVIVRM